VSLADLSKYHQRLAAANPVRSTGKIAEIVGLLVEGQGPPASIGEVCDIYPHDGVKPIHAEVVGFRKGKVLLMPLEASRGMSPGCRIISLGKRAKSGVGKGYLGRVIDGLGQPIDNKGPISWTEHYPLYADSINPLQRRRIKEPVDLGVRVINGLFSCGRGQRMGVFAGSGVGKSILMGMMAKNTDAHVNVIGLIGERGREVREFLEKNLGEAGLRKSVIVVAASDMHPLVRTRAAYLATTIAEYFRDQGQDVLLMIDSLTRFAMALREIGLSVGEPPTTKGYTPSVFSVMPKLLERAGSMERGGSITGLFTVLVEGDDLNDPVADAARSILDGHISLSRQLANQNHYPAVDILGSISRVMIDIVDEEHRKLANQMINVVATYRKAEDLINIGAYVPGSNPDIDYALKMMPRVNAFLRQDMEEKVSFGETRAELKRIFQG
jgi:flagellum-specific ATP synthase